MQSTCWHSGGALDFKIKQKIFLRWFQKGQRVAETKTLASAKAELLFKVSSLVKCSDVCFIVMGDTNLGYSYAP